VFLEAVGLGKWGKWEMGEMGEMGDSLNCAIYFAKRSRMLAICRDEIDACCRAFPATSPSGEWIGA
jgi:hypothetical protein